MLWNLVSPWKFWLSKFHSPWMLHQMLNMLWQGRCTVSFGSVVDAVRFSHAAQVAMLFQTWPADAAYVSGATELAPDGRLLFRGPRIAMGVHTTPFAYRQDSVKPFSGQLQNSHGACKSPLCLQESLCVSISGETVRGGVLGMNSRQLVNLSRIQCQGNAISCSGVHSQHPFSVIRHRCVRSQRWAAAYFYSVLYHCHRRHSTFMGEPSKCTSGNGCNSLMNVAESFSDVAVLVLMRSDDYNGRQSVIHINK